MGFRKQRQAFWTTLKPFSAAGQACLFSWPVPGLPLVFLWASESNVRHCGPPPNPSRQLAGQPATLGIVDRPQTPLSSWQACLFSSPVPGLPLLFLWASESNVRHCGPPPNPSRQLAGYALWTAPKPFSAAGRPASNVRHFGRPQTLLGSWQACLFSSYGLPKATLGIVDRPQTPLGSWQACLFSWPVPGLLLSSYGLPKATLGIVDRPQTLLGSWQASQQR